MKVIDLLNKIANGEINEDTLIEFENGYKDYCSVKMFFNRYIVDRENLNCEVEIIKEKDKEIERLNNIKKKAINELFNLKDMIYKPETREINFDIQNKISSIIKILGSDKE